MWMMVEQCWWRIRRRRGRIWLRLRRLLFGLSTPHPAPVLRELDSDRRSGSSVPGVEVEVEGEDDTWYIPPTMRRRIHAIDEFSVHRVDPLPEYVEEVRNDPLAGPPREDLAADGSEDEMWVALGVVHRSTD
jgi:hypothetical protein